MNYELRTKKLYVILDEKYITTDEVGSGDPTPELVNITTALCEGGAQIIQLREKRKSSKEFLADALEVRKITQKFKTLFIINDRPDIAFLSHADGVHLGESDIPVKEARKLLPAYIERTAKKHIIGASVSSVQSAIKACEEGADYVAVGCLFPSNTKIKELAPLILISDIKKAVNVPVFGIGGITMDKIENVLNAGADGIAIAGDIFNYPDIKERVNEIKTKIRMTKSLIQGTGAASE